MGVELYRKDFDTSQAAHDALPDEGGTVFFEPITYQNDGVFITKPKVKFICPDDGQALMTYYLDQPNSSGELVYADLVKSKGIFVTKGAPGPDYDDFSAAANDFYCEGFKFENARIGSSYNGAGIRGQAKGLKVVRCEGVNCDNVILTSEQRDSMHRPIGYVTILGFKARDCGIGGYSHDAYIGPCARMIVVGAEGTDENLGHHTKLNMGGGVAISLNGFFPDTAVNPEVHCGVDATSGHCAVINCYMKKPNAASSQVNVAKTFYMANDREWSDIGCEYLAYKNHIASMVQRGKGNFFWVEQKNKMKDSGDTRLPPRITGFIGNNLCRYLQNVEKPGYDYGTNPFNVPSGVILLNNDVQTLDVPYEWIPMDLTGAPALTETSMIAFYGWLKDQLPVEGQESVARTITALQGFESYDPMEQDTPVPPEPPVAPDIPAAQADLVQAQVALALAVAEVTSAQARLAGEEAGRKRRLTEHLNHDGAESQDPGSADADS